MGRGGRVGWRPALWRAPLLALGALVGMLVLASPASAHATLESSSPPSGAVLAQAPTTVTLVFDEGITLMPDSVRVFGPDGGQVDSGHVDHARGVAATASVGLRSGLHDGTYLVSYRVVSADSHPVSGAYTFSIGHRSTPPGSVPTAHGSTATNVGLGLSRWLTYAGAALGLGGLVFLSWCWPAGWSSPRARRVVDVGTGLLVAGTLLGLLLKGPYDAGLGPAHAADVDLVREVLGTTYGRALDVRILLLAVVILLLVYRTRLSARVLRWAGVVVVPAVGVTFALCGHAAAGSHQGLAVASVAVHVSAMSVWLGGLALLAGVVLAEDHPMSDALAVVRRFSTVAAVSVGVLVATGVYQAVRELQSWDVLLDSHYGHVLLVKIWLVVIALGAAAGSRAWVWQSKAPTGPPLRTLRSSVALESVAIVGVLIASAMLVTSDPKAARLVSAPVSTTVRAGPDQVRVSVTPAGTRRVSLRLVVLDRDGHPVDPPEVDAAFSLREQQVGPLPVTLTRSGRGVRTGRVSLPLGGEWQLAVTVRTTAIDEATAYVEVPVG
ncbi:MAG: copper resistance protein CopC [Nocardioides sp.]